MTITRTSKKIIQALRDGTTNKFPINGLIPISHWPVLPGQYSLAVARSPSNFNFSALFKSNFASRNLWSLGATCRLALPFYSELLFCVGLDFILCYVTTFWTLSRSPSGVLCLIDDIKWINTVY